MEVLEAIFMNTH